MAKNKPPPNATNAAVVMAEGHPIAWCNPLANLNGNLSHGLGPKPVNEGQEDTVDAKLDLEQQKIKSALKNLVDLETKLVELSDKCGLQVSKLQIALKANKKAAVTDLSLQEKI
jgi:hypothetical protein